MIDFKLWAFLFFNAMLILFCSDLLEKVSKRKQPSAHVVSESEQEKKKLKTSIEEELRYDSNNSDAMNKQPTFSPYFAKGIVVKGFGRGSKELGIPTANFSDAVVEELPAKFECGVYYGWAVVDNGPVYRMVMSVGWNPFYKNTKKTMEIHILHSYDEDFYGSLMRICVSGYIRPERSFSSVDELIKEIRCDISIAEEQLGNPDQITLSKHEFFKESVNNAQNNEQKD